MPRTVGTCPVLSTLIQFPAQLTVLQALPAAAPEHHKQNTEPLPLLLRGSDTGGGKRHVEYHSQCLPSCRQHCPWPWKDTGQLSISKISSKSILKTLRQMERKSNAALCPLEASSPVQEFPTPSCESGQIAVSTVQF